MKVRMEKTGEGKTGQMNRNERPMAEVEVQLYLLYLKRGYSKWPLHLVFLSLNLNKIHSIPNVNVYDWEDYVILFSFLRLYLYEFRGALICPDLPIKKICIIWSWLCLVGRWSKNYSQPPAHPQQQWPGIAVIQPWGEPHWPVHMQQVQLGHHRRVHVAYLTDTSGVLGSRITEILPLGPTRHLT